MLCTRLGSVQKPDLPCVHTPRRGTSERSAGGQPAPSACWIHYIHKLIGGRGVFGLAAHHLLPAMFTEAMCQFIKGSPRTSALQPFMMWRVMWAALSLIFVRISIFWGPRFVKVISDQCEDVSCRAEYLEVRNKLIVDVGVCELCSSRISWCFMDSLCNILLLRDCSDYPASILPLIVRNEEAEYVSFPPVLPAG